MPYTLRYLIIQLFLRQHIIVFIMRAILISVKIKVKVEGGFRGGGVSLGRVWMSLAMLLFKADFLERIIN